MFLEVHVYLGGDCLGVSINGDFYKIFNCFTTLRFSRKNIYTNHIYEPIHCHNTTTYFKNSYLNRLTVRR